MLLLVQIVAYAIPNTLFQWASVTAVNVTLASLTAVSPMASSLFVRIPDSQSPSQSPSPSHHHTRHHHGLPINMVTPNPSPFVSNTVTPIP